jgi:adenosylcobinamide-GDP ribazoletransferase
MSEDHLPQSPKAEKAASPLTAFLAAVQFLLLSPAFIRREFSNRELGASVGYYPLVGLLLGGLLAATDGLLGYLFPLPLRSVLTLALWIVLTGALHLDGFLDACDGLLGGFTPDRRLEIMRDERVGAYALAGGFLLLLTQAAALMAIQNSRAIALILAPTLGRWGMALALTAFPYARASGLGKTIKENAGTAEAILATIFAATTLLGSTWLDRSWAPLAAAIVASLTWWAVIRFTLKRIPGLTGDIYGALNILIETTALLIFAALEYHYG